jgi:hypothetical protein
MTGQYSAVTFNRGVHPQRAMILVYIEKTPSAFHGMYWDQNRLSENQEPYLEQLELRGTAAFTVTSYSMF